MPRFRKTLVIALVGLSTPLASLPSLHACGGRGGFGGGFRGGFGGHRPAYNYGGYYNHSAYRYPSQPSYVPPQQPYYPTQPQTVNIPPRTTPQVTQLPSAPRVPQTATTALGQQFPQQQFPQQQFSQQQFSQAPAQPSPVQQQVPVQQPRQQFVQQQQATVPQTQVPQQQIQRPAPQQPVQTQPAPQAPVQQPTQPVQPQAPVQSQAPVQQQPAPTQPQQPEAAPGGPETPAISPPEENALKALAGLLGETTPAAPATGSTPVAPSTPAEVPPHVGTWRAELPNGATITLTLQADGTFLWLAQNSGKTSSFSGTYTFEGESLTLFRSSDNQKLAGSITRKGDHRFQFKLEGAKDGGLNFARSST